VFKGGTCLRKCYFGDYRFSEDLDFTLNNFISQGTLKEIFLATNQEVQSKTGIRFDEKDSIVEIVKDDYGKESFECKAYFRGPLGFGGSLPAIRIHLNCDEVILFPVRSREIYHSYSDQMGLPQSRLPVYSLEEILVEKLRAFSGQRKFAIARDIYDIFYLIKWEADSTAALKLLDKKCSVKGIDIKNIDPDLILRRKEEYEINWKNNLEYLVPNDLKIPFQEAWDISIDSLKKALRN